MQHVTHLLLVRNDRLTCVTYESVVKYVALGAELGKSTLRYDLR